MYSTYCGSFLSAKVNDGTSVALGAVFGIILSTAAGLVGTFFILRHMRKVKEERVARKEEIRKEQLAKAKASELTPMGRETITAKFDEFTSGYEEGLEEEVDITKEVPEEEVNDMN